MSDYPWYERYYIGSKYPLLLSHMADIPREERGGIRLLDLPAGNGVMALPLKAAGFDVVACDLFPEELQATVEAHGGKPIDPGWHEFGRGRFSPSLVRRLFGDGDVRVPTELPCVPGDMGDRLPFDDASFDWVVSIEGIEHIENRHAVIREMRRVLRPGGTLLMTTPNLLSIRARMSTALTGQRTFSTWFDEFSGVQARADDGRIYHGHAFLADYFELRYGLHNYGFSIQRLLPGRQSFTSALFLPFMLPFIALSTWRAIRVNRRRFERFRAKGVVAPDVMAPHTEMRRHLLSLPLLLNRVIIIEATAV